MKNKYYIPKIEEFFIGFEYETNYLSDVWESRLLSLSEADYFFNTYYADAVATEFRVKFLDKDDIESLGFNEIGNGWYHQFPNDNREGYQILYSGKALDISFGIHEHSKTVFKGVIKNKSELKKLLTQLGIIE